MYDAHRTRFDLCMNNVSSSYMSFKESESKE